MSNPTVQTNAHGVEIFSDQIFSWDETRDIGPGEGWYAAANVPHGGEIISDESAVFIDIYSPATRWILDVLATGRKLPPRIARE